MRGMKRGLAAAGLGIFLLAAAGCGLGRRVLESQLGGQSAQEEEGFLAEESAGTEAGSWLERLWRSLWPQADDEGEDEDRAGANGWGADGVAATEEELEVALQAAIAGGGEEDTSLSQVRSLAEYEIESLEGNRAEIEITSPDVMKMVEDCVSSGQAEDGSEIPGLIEERMKSGDYPTRTYTVQVEMENQGGTWQLLSGGELENALSGGVYEAYSRMVSQYVREVEER